MKKLTLGEILPVIDGRMWQGSDTLYVTHAENEPDVRADHTLLFLFDEDLEDFDLKSWNRYDGGAVIVERKSRAYEQLTRGHHSIRGAVVEVDHLYRAYWKFVAYYRGLFALPVICVTGTAGKTSTKEMIKHLVTERYNVQATVSSKNSSTYNFSYLMGIDDETDVAVFETGVAYYPGDIPHSCKFFQPTVGVITNIGVDHIRGCGSLENYIKAKGEMMKGLQNKGTLILNADDENTAKLDLSGYEGRVVRFGTSKAADLRATDIRYSEKGMTFTLTYQHMKHRAFVPGFGEHQVYNMLAALAAVHTIGIGIREAVERMRSFPQVPKRLQVLSGVNGCTVLDDTWSSNPKSVESALQALQLFPKNRKKIAVIGRMSSQLHEMAEEEHEKMGEVVAACGIDLLITRGELAQVIGKSAIKHGMKKNKVAFCADSDEVYEMLKPHLDNSAVIVVKTSTNDSSSSLLKKLTREQQGRS